MLFKLLPSDEVFKSMKVVINNCYGGFRLSEKGLKLYQNLSGTSWSDENNQKRSDPILVKVVEQLGDEANGRNTKLLIETIPEEYVKYEAWDIHEYDGMERIIHLDDKLGFKKTIEALRQENKSLRQEVDALKQCYSTTPL